MGFSYVEIAFYRKWSPNLDVVSKILYEIKSKLDLLN